MPTSAIEIVRPYGTLPVDERARVLVNRLWPRGVRRSALEPFEWMQDIAPSTELRRWYGHDPELADEFRASYCDELTRSPARECLIRLKALARRPGVLLITATRDVELSEAWVIRDMLLAGTRQRRR